MIEVKKEENVIPQKTNLAFEDKGVLNPAVIFDNGEIHLFYKAQIACASISISALLNELLQHKNK